MIHNRQKWAAYRLKARFKSIEGPGLKALSSRLQLSLLNQFSDHAASAHSHTAQYLSHSLSRLGNIVLVRTKLWERSNMPQLTAALRTRPTGFKLFSSPPSKWARLSTYMAKVRQTVCMEESCTNFGLRVYFKSIYGRVQTSGCELRTHAGSYGGSKDEEGMIPMVPGL